MTKNIGKSLYIKHAKTVIFRSQGVERSITALDASRNKAQQDLHDQTGTYGLLRVLAGLVVFLVLLLPAYLLRQPISLGLPHTKQRHALILILLGLLSPFSLTDSMMSS